VSTLSVSESYFTLLGRFTIRVVLLAILDDDDTSLAEHLHGWCKNEFLKQNLVTEEIGEERTFQSVLAFRV
jgi:hypothetical protein